VPSIYFYFYFFSYFKSEIYIPLLPIKVIGHVNLSLLHTFPKNSKQDDNKLVYFISWSLAMKTEKKIRSKALNHCRKRTTINRIFFLQAVDQFDEQLLALEHLFFFSFVLSSTWWSYFRANICPLKRRRLATLWCQRIYNEKCFRIEHCMDRYYTLI
jgi:hypothetical protein